MFVKTLALAMILVPVVAMAQKPPSPPQMRSVVLAYQQLGLSLEAMAAYYEARIADLEKRCGDPCKEQ